MATYHFNKTISFSIHPVFMVSPAGQICTPLSPAGLKVGQVAQAADHKFNTWLDSPFLSAPYSHFSEALVAGHAWHKN